MSRHRQSLALTRRPSPATGVNEITLSFPSPSPNLNFPFSASHLGTGGGGRRLYGRLGSRATMARLGRLGGFGMRGEGTALAGMNGMMGVGEHGMEMELGMPMMGNTGMLGGGYGGYGGYRMQAPIMGMGRGTLAGEELIGRQQDGLLERRRLDNLRGQQCMSDPYLTSRRSTVYIDSRHQATSLSMDDYHMLDIQTYRQARPYHYRYPYVEDDISEECLRQQDLLEMEALGLSLDDHHGGAGSIEDEYLSIRERERGEAGEGDCLRITRDGDVMRDGFGHEL
ncbi:hypothetical protein BJ878DRAFT_542706 [Calycina marina]|uniref:Uncharacterized protein n=1 Tax=Calycina marina TaxID=1763456 RepID=A0A9P7Z1S3_9HELO|nr:hypothetical protein BJ878DRAFT_542706 [Calycina marina]